MSKLKTCKECIHYDICSRFTLGTFENDSCQCFENVDEFVKLKEGNWILEKEPDGTPYCYHCSLCDNDFHYIGITSAYNYCPNCGAKMNIEVII